MGAPVARARISIHAPREGSDERERGGTSTPPQFLSTLPARGATHRPRQVRPLGCDFYPRSPRGERLAACGLDAERADQDFYPRSPRGERLYVFGYLLDFFAFLSTLPARGATAPLVLLLPSTAYFYPRSPRGERRPQRGRDNVLGHISIHAPREGSDSFVSIFH